MRLPCALLLAVQLPALTQAQRGGCTPRHPMVDAVRFSGNKVIPSADLAPIIATERTGLFRRWYGWNVGPLTCLDSTDLRSDALRIRDLYKQRGYPGTVVRSRVTRNGVQRAQVFFEVVESVPIVVDSVTVIGVPPEVIDAVSIATRLQGVPLDDSVVTAGDDPQSGGESVHGLVVRRVDGD